MLPQSSCLCYVALAVVLTPSVTQALPPVRAQNRLVTIADDTPQNGSAVPGDSPVKYHNDPGNDLFKIESLDMFPNPCVIESYCGILIHGTFTTSLTNTTPHLSFNVTSHFPDGRTGLIPGEDALCNWIDIEEDDDDDDRDSSSDDSTSTRTHKEPPPNDDVGELHPNLAPTPPNPILHKQTRKEKLSCPPSKGKAQISSTVLLLGGWVPEALFTVRVKATEEGRGGRTIFDLWTEFDLRYKDDGAVMVVK